MNVRAIDALRVGGPYEIRFAADGFRELRLDGVTLKPGVQPPLAVTLTRLEIEEVVATATVPVTLRDLNNGVGSAYSTEDIASQPGVTRDVIRTLLRDPLAQSAGVGNLSVGGVNPRFNGLAIDGSLQQDDFGLGTSTSTSTYATSRSPISLDAVESASLVASDYSVTASGFTGRARRHRAGIRGALGPQGIAAGGTGLRPRPGRVRPRHRLHLHRTGADDVDPRRLPVEQLRPDAAARGAAHRRRAGRAHHLRGPRRPRHPQPGGARQSRRGPRPR